MLKKAIVALALGAFAIAPTGGAVEAKTIKVQASAAAGSFSYRYMTTKWAPLLEKMSGGKLKIEIAPTKAIVPHRETIDAVSNGILDGDLNAVAYFAGRDAGFALMGDLIAGYDTPDQVQMFCMNGGGKEVLQKLYDKYTKGKVHVIGCGPFAKEALVSTKPIRSVAEFKGVKIRSPEGLASEVFKRVGAAPVAIPFSEVYTSLEKGIVEAADASSYVNNDSKGMHRIAKYPLYPGIHSMAILQFIINKDVWNKLSEAERAILDVWYLASHTDLRRATDLQDRQLVARDRAGKGPVTEVIDWTQAERDKFRAVAVKAWEDYSKQSPLAKEAYEAHVKFMKMYGLLK
ncbi:MAG: TRAP transporter substrate-binding protein [Hyphomicrobiales bacterium]|nr:TRAP transporter substrate-binding protein [Hyphomicrobiales bacterium]